MTMLATKVKLEVTDPLTVVTLLVTECVEVEGNYGPQARITGTDEDGNAVTLYEKLDAVTRQLGRIGLDIRSAHSQRLAFWKEMASNSAGQTFKALRIASMTAAPLVAPKPAARTAQPTALGGPLPYEQQETGAPPAVIRQVEPMPSWTLDAKFAVYSRCLDYAVKEALRVGIDKLNGDVAGAVVASAATLFIQANKP